MSSDRNLKSRVARRLGWVPNLFTLANLWMGFFAILFSFSGMHTLESFRLAGALILLAALCDGLDGYAARLLDAKSDLGAQLDSLADLTTFGIAPAALMYSSVLSGMDRITEPYVRIPLGMIIAAVYPACAAYRLARFNVTHDDNSFSGLPSPVAGIIVALMSITFGETIQVSPYLLTVVFLLVAFLMVSTLKYAKPQVTIVRRFSKGRLAIVVAFILCALAFAWIQYGPEFAGAGMLTLIGAYTMSGLVAFVIHSIQENRM